ncbi:MAG: hypothetical protein F6K54_23525 [Okeania sp. SIO3B5]|nr:hypothetical protein [Okeania sp. SIO3B5]
MSDYSNSHTGKVQNSRFQGTGNREQGTGNREQGTGNREQGIGNRQKIFQILNGICCIIYWLSF